VSACVICGSEHDRVWELPGGATEPAMYCARCRKMKDDAEGTVTEVFKARTGSRLYLGDWESAQEFDGERICVHERSPAYGVCWHMPILVVPPKSKFDRSGAIAPPERLDAVALTIDTCLTTGRKVLVHCQGGVERSPLAVAWWHAHGDRRLLPQAYEWLKALRPVIADRTSWLP